MEDLSLHMLDIVENSLRSQARLVEILVIEDVERDLLTLEIRDDGKGMDAETCARATDPFFTTKPGHRTGLGLALLAQAAREAGGDLRVSSSVDVGTTVRATFRWSHPDRRPLGDISATLETLVVANPTVDFVCEQRRGADVLRFDTREVRHTCST
jgi:signal transduction histidine kinase